ncbi:Mu-like prophage FluMu DNA transposition protein B [Amedibacterium intestinale]|uniref:Mu-like prophage FluMu DNA transposition protein B n=1 Tax=Amedibacterium intestinale TaxID=2583452 RepID=A0A6N4TIZ1_9FIRM|nr:AAA family ATPase [Amedibacterium intestinale]BBK22753.1 Mu-like prophage FluMu DNA transposition protein B [Amedibacterium intestinale]
MRNENIKERLEAYMKESGLSQAKIAPLIGVSMTALSQYRNGIYKGDVKAVESKIEEYMETVEEQQAQEEKAQPYKAVEDYIPTSVSEDIYRMIRYAQVNGGIAIAHGDAGIGKTKAAQKYVRENPTQAIYLEMSPVAGTLGNMLRLLARTLKLPESRNKMELTLSIREKLEGTNKVIIIDEAQHLKLSALEQIRTLADPNSITGTKGVGIVLIGNTEVYSKMKGKQEAQFAQLFSRIKMSRYYSTSNVTDEDVEKLFPVLKKQGMKKELGFLKGICKSKWGIRGATNVYDNSINNDDVSVKGLYAMARTLGIEVI